MLGNGLLHITGIWDKFLMYFYRINNPRIVQLELSKWVHGDMLLNLQLPILDLSYIDQNFII